MADDFNIVHDMPDHFYYLDLKSALKDLRLSEDGIHQIQTKTPVSNSKDRKAIRQMLIRLVHDEQRWRGKDVIDGTWGHIKGRWKEIGFSLKGIEQIEKDEQMASPEDRELLLRVLKKWLVTNESAVPRGYPGHMRAAWKRIQVGSRK